MFGLDAGLGFAILAALLLGTYLFVIKRFFSEYPSTVYVCVSYGFALAWYLPVAALAIDGSLLPAGFDLTGAAVLAASLGFTVVGTLSVFRALAAGEVSYVAPISKIIPAFVLPLELTLFDERLTSLQLAGIAAATGAVYVANYEPGELIEPFRQAARSQPARLALLSAAAFAVVDTSKRALMQEIDLDPAVYVVLLFAVIPLATGPLAARRGFDGLRSDVPLFALAGLVLAVANHIMMISFSALPASIASPVINTQAIVAVVLGGVVLGEDAFRVRLAAAALAVAGVALIALG